MVPILVPKKLVEESSMNCMRETPSCSIQSMLNRPTRGLQDCLDRVRALSYVSGRITSTDFIHL